MNDHSDGNYVNFREQSSLLGYCLVLGKQGSQIISSPSYFTNLLNHSKSSGDFPRNGSTLSISTFASTISWVNRFRIFKNSLYVVLFPITLLHLSKNSNSSAVLGLSPLATLAFFFGGAWD